MFGLRIDAMGQKAALLPDDLCIEALEAEQAQIKRIEEYNPLVNAITYKHFDQAMAEAKIAQEKRGPDEVEQIGIARAWGQIENADAVLFLHDLTRRHLPDYHADDELIADTIAQKVHGQVPVIEVWSRAKVTKHLKKYNKVGNRHYALTDENNFEMYARKCALLQVLKYMPTSIEVANAIAVSDAVESGRHAVIDGDIVMVHDTEDDGGLPPPPAALRPSAVR